jgi:hypothetical protein
MDQTVFGVKQDQYDGGDSRSGYREIPQEVHIESVQRSEIRCSSFLRRSLVWLSEPASERHAESVDPQISAVGDIRFCGRSGHDICRCTGPDHHVPTSIELGHEPTHGSDIGNFSNSLDLLRPVNWFAPGDPVERHRSADQFPKRRRVSSLRSQRESRLRALGCDFAPDAAHSYMLGKSVPQPVSRSPNSLQGAKFSLVTSDQKSN